MTDFVLIARRVRAAVTTAVTLVMAYALFVSREHITHVAHAIGVPGWQAETAFILVDLPALIGRVLQMKYFAPTTQRTGRRLTYLSGTLSLACNVGSGVILGKPGAAAWGAFVVMMFVILEGVIAKIKPAAKVTRQRNAANDAPKTAPKVASPQQRGAATRKRNRELKALEAAYAAQAAPVSGA